MKTYTFKPNAAEIIGLAGISQAELASRANIDRANLNKRMHNAMPLRITTAASIAQAFAELRGITQETAIALLFEEHSDE